MLGVKWASNGRRRSGPPRHPAEWQQRQRRIARTSVAPPEEAVDRGGRG